MSSTPSEMTISSSTTEIQEAPVITPRQMMSGHTDHVQGVAHLPDGQRIVSCSLDGSLRLWDLESGVQIGDKWRDQVVVGVELVGVDVVEGVEVFEMVEMVEGVEVVRGFEVSEGLEEVEEVEWDDGAAPVAKVWTISLSPNGVTVAIGSEDGTVRLWNVETGKVIAKWTGHTDIVRSVCWSPDGERVLSGSDDETARVWDVKSGETVLTIKTGHQVVWAVIYSPDSSQIATGGYEDGVKIWDAKTGELLATLKHEWAVLSLAWTSDGNKLISGSYGPIRIFETANWEQIAILEGNTYVNAISLFQNDRLLASASHDKTAHLWNLNTNIPVGPPLQHESRINCATFSADGKVLVTGCNDKNAYVWDVYVILQEAGLEDLLSIPNVPAVKSFMDTDATQDHQLLPDFFHDAQDRVDGVRSRSSRRPRRVLVPSLGSPTALLARLSLLFHRPQINAGAATQLQQCPRRTILSRHRPRVDVAAVRDRQALFVARRPERDKPKPASQQPQHQPQASTSQTFAASTSTTPPAPAPAPAHATSIVTPSAAIAQPRRPIPLWARLVLFICCASPPDTNGH